MQTHPPFLILLALFAFSLPLSLAFALLFALHLLRHVDTAMLELYIAIQSRDLSSHHKWAWLVNVTKPDIIIT